MDAQQLIDRLEERAAGVPVGPPPLGLMRTRARRQRQGRAAVVAAAAAVAVIGVGVAWPGGWGGGSDSPTTVASDTPADPDTPPDGYRYVGEGSVVAAVPEDWGTNEVECGTPMEDTVVIDQGVTCLMAVPRPADVDSLIIQRAGSSDLMDRTGLTRVKIGDEWAFRSQVTERDGVARQSLVVLATDTVFVAESSSENGADVVAGLLDSLTLLRDHTTVPGFQDLAFQRSGHRQVDDYVDLLERLGLQAEVVTRDGGGLDTGTVLETVPAVGTVVAPGDTVRVVTAR